MSTAAQHRIVACHASPDYQLHLRFDDGLAGAVYLGNLLDLGAFTAWRNVRLFLTARADPETGSVWWPAGGVRLDPEILYADVASRYEGYSRQIASDDSFERFIQRATAEHNGPIGPLRLQRRGAGRSASAKRAWARRKRPPAS